MGNLGTLHLIRVFLSKMGIFSVCVENGLELGATGLYTWDGRRSGRLARLGVGGTRHE